MSLFFFSFIERANISYKVLKLHGCMYILKCTSKQRERKYKVMWKIFYWSSVIDMIFTMAIFPMLFYGKHRCLAARPGKVSNIRTRSTPNLPCFSSLFLTGENVSGGLRNGHGTVMSSLCSIALCVQSLCFPLWGWDPGT